MKTSRKWLLVLAAGLSITACAEVKSSTTEERVFPDAGDTSDALDDVSAPDTATEPDLNDSGDDAVDSLDDTSSTLDVSDLTDTSDDEDMGLPDSFTDGATDVADGFDAQDTSVPDGGNDLDDGGEDTVDVEPVSCNELSIPATFGDELPLEGDWREGELGDCAPFAHVAIGSREAVYSLEFLGLPADARVAVYSPHYFSTDEPTTSLQPIALSEPMPGLVRDVEFSPDHSGEVVVHVETDDPASASYEVRYTCVENCDKIATRFPIILLHGLFGTNSYLGILDYWFGIEDAWDELGIEYRVLTSGLIRNSERRAELIADDLEAILANTGARKLNLYGHSQGGLDARIVTSPNGQNMGDRIASATSLATPHRGVPIDLAGLLVLFGIQNFTEDAAAEFNETYIDHPSVQFYSWAGKTCGRLEIGCRLETGGEVVDPFLSVFYALIRAQGYENDGLVTVPSSKWGTYLGALPADHLDEVGQIADGALDFEPFDQVEFFVDEVYRLIEADY